MKGNRATGDSFVLDRAATSQSRNACYFIILDYRRSAGGGVAFTVLGLQLHVSVVNVSYFVEGNVLGFQVMFSSVIPQEMINYNSIKLGRVASAARVTS